MKASNIIVKLFDEATAADLETALNAFFATLGEESHAEIQYQPVLAAVDGTGAAPGDQTEIFLLQGTAVTAASTFYYGVGVSSRSTTEGPRIYRLPIAKQVRRLYVETSTAQPGDGDLVIRVRKNAVDTALLVTIPAGAAAGVFTNLADVVAFAAGDQISVSGVNASASASAVVDSGMLVLSDSVAPAVAASIEARYTALVRYTL